MKSPNDHKLMILYGGLTDSNVHIHPEVLCLGETFFFRFAVLQAGPGASRTAHRNPMMVVIYCTFNYLLRRIRVIYPSPYIMLYRITHVFNLIFFPRPIPISIVLQVVCRINCSLHCT